MRRFFLVLVIVAACSSGHRTKQLSPADAARLLIDRNWIDVMPESPKDRLHVFRFVPSMGGGVFQDRTLYRGEFELFTFTTGDGAIGFTFPDTGERVRTAYTIEEGVEGCEPFDLRLTLAHSPRGPRVYYGMSKEHGSVEAMLSASATP